MVIAAAIAAIAILAETSNLDGVRSGFAVAIGPSAMALLAWTWVRRAELPQGGLRIGYAGAASLFGCAVLMSLSAIQSSKGWRIDLPAGALSISVLAPALVSWRCFAPSPDPPMARRITVAIVVLAGIAALGIMADEAYEDRERSLERSLETDAAQSRWHASNETREQPQSFAEFRWREGNEGLIESLLERVETEGIDISDIIADIRAKKYPADFSEFPTFFDVIEIESRIEEARKGREPNWQAAP
jgi:hypothetical protein